MSSKPISGDEPSIGGQRKSDDVQLGGDSAVLHLVNSLNHADLTVRKRAAFLLAARGDDRAYDALIHLFHEADPSLQPAIIKSLGNLGDRRAVSMLLARVRDEDERGAVRFAAVEALGAIGDPDAVEPLMVQLETHTLSGLNAAVVRALTRIPDRRSLGLLLSQVSSISFVYRPTSHNEDILNYVKSLYSDELRVELLALAGQGIYGAIQVLNELHDPELAPLLMALIQDAIDQKDQMIGSWIHIALGATGNTEVVEPMITMLQSLDFEENGPVGRSIISALGLLRDPRAVDVLLPFLDTPSYWHAAASLGTIGDPRALEPMIKRLRQARQSKDRNAEQAMLYGLGKLGDPQAFAEIEKSLRSKDSFVRRRAVESLGRINAPQAVAPLLQALRHKDDDTQHEAFKALTAYYPVDYRVRYAIRALLDEGDRKFQLPAAFIMAEHGEPYQPVIDILATYLSLGGYQRQRADRLLRKIGTPEALAARRVGRQLRNPDTDDYGE